MKKFIEVIFLLLVTSNIFSQKDSLDVNSKYWEDQLYINITYNIFNNQPEDVSTSEFSYGLSFGYIKDIPLNKKNTFAFGIGLGYNYDLFTHSLVVNNTNNFTVNEAISSNKLKTHNIEFPLQIRWRTSDAVTYSFWRIYAGVRISYNLANKFSYTLEDEDFNFNNIDNYNRLQTGIELSVGYGAFNLYTYYGLSSVYDNATYNAENIDTSILKLGLIFYLL